MRPQKKRPSHFDRQIQRSGENFLELQNPQQIKTFHVPRILSDIAYGNIDYEKHGMYLQNPTLLQALRDTTAEKAYFYAVSADGVKMMITASEQQQQQGIAIDQHHLNNIIAIHEIHSGASNYYSILNEALNNYYNTGSIEYFHPVAQRIKNYIKFIG